MEHAWRKLEDPSDCSALMASCPVCFLTTTNNASRNNEPNAMVISWLTTATRDDNSLLLSMNQRRHTASVVQVGNEFGLSIPVQGMEETVRNVGSVSAKWTDCHSKFPSTNNTTTTDTSTMSRRAKQKFLQQNGVPGLKRVNLGTDNVPPSSGTEDDVFAIQGTIAHLRCRLVQKEANIVDDDHYFLQAKIQQAFVRDDYWNANTKALAPKTRGDPCTLSFFGSGIFGSVCGNNISNPNAKLPPSETTSLPWIHLKEGKELSRLLYTNPLCLFGVEYGEVLYALDRLTATNNEGSFLFCLDPGQRSELVEDSTFQLYVPTQGMEELVKQIQKRSKAGQETTNKKPKLEDTAATTSLSAPQVAWQPITLAAQEEASGNNGNNNPPSCVSGCVAWLQCRVSKTIDRDNAKVVLGQIEQAYVHPLYWDSQKKRLVPNQEEGCPPCLKRLGRDSIGYLLS